MSPTITPDQFMSRLMYSHASSSAWPRRLPLSRASQVERTCMAGLSCPYSDATLKRPLGLRSLFREAATTVISIKAAARRERRRP